MKNSIIRISALITILFAASTFGSSQGTTTARVQPDKGAASSRTSVSKKATADSVESDLKEALAVVEGNYANTKQLNYNEVFKTSIVGMLHTLDPHSNYFDAKEFEQFMTDQSSRYYGIGATIGDLSDPKGDVIATYIKATFEGAPAYKAGLRYGDKIVRFSGPRAGADGKITQVKNESLLGKNFSEVRSYLRGPEGTTIQLTVQHLSGAEETVNITRGAVPQPSISEIYMIKPGVGYLAMRGGFNQTTSKEFDQGLRQLKAAGATQFILDLRDNGGGLVREAYRVADSFLNYGQTVFTQKGRIEGVNEVYPADNRAPDRSPIVMLVNRNTASASEILAGALQDHDRALIVGETTFGKGLVQNPFRLEYGSMLLLTIAKYQTPSGRQIQRDYSNGDLYDYYYEGGSLRDEKSDDTRPKGAESKTDTGRAVYSGGGINPDVLVKADTIPIERGRSQSKLLSPIFAFALDVMTGKVKGFDAYRVNKAITIDYDIKASDYPVTEPMFQAFRRYTEDKYKIPAAQVDREREFVERFLRTEFITAAYGSTSSFQVTNGYDNQLLKAIDLLPQARQLAMQSEKNRLNGSSQSSRAN